MVTDGGILKATSAITGIGRDALWLIAVGALLIAVSVLAGGHVGGLSGRPIGRAGRRSDRVLYALGFTGAAIVAIGSFLAAAAAFPAKGMFAGSIVGAVATWWIVSAWRLRIDGQRSLEDSESMGTGLVASTNQDVSNQLDWDVRRYQRQQSWRWCIRHAFSSESSALAEAERALGQRPANH